MEPLLRSHPDKRSTPLERPLSIFELRYVIPTFADSICCLSAGNSFIITRPARILAILRLLSSSMKYTEKGTHLHTFDKK